MALAISPLLSQPSSDEIDLLIIVFRMHDIVINQKF
jgi:hypothetical protein